MRALRFALVVSLALLASGPARAQLPLVRLDRLYPQGGRSGTTVEVSVSGDHFEDVRALRADDPGLKAEFVKQDGNRAVFRLSVGTGVTPGMHDVRAIGRYGISNPALFDVNDSLTEVEEKEPNDTPAQANAVPLNCVINGTTDSSGDDCFRWKATKGQRVIMDCAGYRLGNNVDPTLALLSPAGKEVAFNRDFNGPDPLLDFTVPEDGEYTVRLYDFNYNGGQPYRLRISTGPYLDSLFPPAVLAGAPAAVTVFGRNLPGGLPTGLMEEGAALQKLVVNLPPAVASGLQFFDHPPCAFFAADGFQYRLPGSNPTFVALAGAPLVEEREPNDSPSQGQVLTAPCEVQARLQKPGDQDWYSIQLKQGQTLALAAYCERIGAQGDLVILVQGADGKDLQELDDSGPSYNQRFTPHNRDPEGLFSAPRDGVYHILVADRYQRGGSRFRYRLRVSPPQPDYRAVLVHNTENIPSALLIRQGGSQHYHLIVERQDGFDGEIGYSVENLPKGVTCPNGTFGHGVNLLPLVFTATADAPPGEAAIRVHTWATIDGRRVERDARSVTQSVANQQGSRMARDIVLAVRPSAPFAAAVLPVTLTIPQGGAFDLKVSVSRRWPEFKNAVQLAGMDIPSGFNVATGTVAPKQSDGTIHVTIAGNVRPGTYTLVLQAEAQVPFTKDPSGKDLKDVRVVDPSPPISVVVTPK